MINFVLILLCIGLGMLFRHYELTPADAHKGINVWLINVGLPAVALKYIPQIEWGTQVLFPLFSPVLVWFGAFVLMYLFARKNLLHTATQTSMTLTGGLSNTSFVGFPLIMAYFGEQYLRIAIICDQVTFFLFSTLGLVQSMMASKVHGGIQAKAILKRLFTFPPLLGCIVALSLPRFVDISGVNPLFSALAATVSPMALFSVGLQLKFSGWWHEIKLISVSMLYKLMLAPALVLLVAVLLNLHGDYVKIGIFEAAMPTLISASIMAEQYQLNTKLTNLTIGISIIVSLFTTGLWYFLIERFV